jgi:carboxyl-terminal processing protease
MKRRAAYIFGGAALLVAGALFMAAEHPDLRLGRSIETMVNIMREVERLYVDPVEPEELLKDAAAGLSMNLDPYTVYMPADETGDFEMMTTGRYGGIGSIIRPAGGYIAIAQPYEGSPADKAGLVPGDRLLEIDGVSVAGMTTDRVSAMLKGDAGTTFTLKVRKLAGGSEQTVAITRERIAIPAVPYVAMLDDGIGYIEHTDFSENSSDEMRRAIESLMAEGELRGLILDYRSNGGGILQEAVRIVSMFVPRGTEVVSTRGRGEKGETYRTAGDPVLADIPVAVLTGSRSASAAEIVAGAMQDLDRGVLVGQRTFGKGLVQTTRPVGYDALLKITTAKYYTPSGRCIQAIDYANRNDDGSVSSVPDSLVREFTTRGGRKVYDGGGVMPDVRIEPEYMSLFTALVYGRGYIEEFGDRYTARNPKPVAADFAITDAIYDEFVRFMDGKEVEYESGTRLALDELKVRAERELYYDAIGEQIAQIEARLHDDKRSSLALYRRQLGELIENDLIMRGHYMRGVTARRIGDDPEVTAAVALLKDGERYRNILTSQDTARK